MQLSSTWVYYVWSTSTASTRSTSAYKCIEWKKKCWVHLIEPRTRANVYETKERQSCAWPERLTSNDISCLSIYTKKNEYMHKQSILFFFGSILVSFIRDTYTQTYIHTGQIPSHARTGSHTYTRVHTNTRFLKFTLNCCKNRIVKATYLEQLHQQNSSIHFSIYYVCSILALAWFFNRNAEF